MSKDHMCMSMLSGHQGRLHEASVDMVDWLFDIDSRAASLHEVRPLILAWVPCVALLAVGYTVGILGYNRLVPLSNKPAGPVTLALSRGWNLAMCLFSTAGSYYTLPFLLDMANIDNYSSDIKLECLLWIFLYILSKPFELIDTAFLVAKRRKVLTLHWTHHVITMLFTWYAGLTLEFVGIYFGIVNMLVHSIMYGYYFGISFPVLRPVLRPLSKVVTIIQISQFFAILSGMVFFYHHMTLEMFVVTLLMYLYYFCIFLRFFIQKNLTKPFCSQCHQPAAKLLACQECAAAVCSKCLADDQVCLMCQVSNDVDLEELEANAIPAAQRSDVAQVADE
jgi:hypothetical protein